MLSIRWTKGIALSITPPNHDNKSPIKRLVNGPGISDPSTGNTAMNDSAILSCISRYWQQ
jgi:ABC-type transport system involved in cytochrome c biogenesis ATPase subunit